MILSLVKFIFRVILRLGAMALIDAEAAMRVQGLDLVFG